MATREPTAVELAMLEAVQQGSSATVPGPSPEALEFVYRQAYASGFKSCLAAVQRAEGRGVEPADMLRKLQHYLDGLRGWAFGKRQDKPRMTLWK